MISNTEWLILGIMLPYTIMIIGGIHRYEAKIKKLKKEINLLDTLNLIQKDIIANLDKDNEILKKLTSKLKSKLAGDDRNIQYESSTYKSNTYETNTTYMDEDMNPPFVTKYGPKFDVKDKND